MVVKSENPGGTERGRWKGRGGFDMHVVKPTIDDM